MDRPLIIGAQAEEPNGVTIWRIVRRYFIANGVPVDYALFSSYEALDEAVLRGSIDIAWLAPLPHAQTLIQSGGGCRSLAMRDTDRDVTTVMLTRADSPVAGLADLPGKRVALGERNSSELSIIPGYQLHQDGFDVAAQCELVELQGSGHSGGLPVDARTYLAALDDGTVDAATLFEPYFKMLADRGRIDPAKYRVIWRSRPYSHCGFAARPGLPEDVGRKFVELLAAMDYNNPEIKEMMDLEHLRAWVPADSTGWQDLVSGIKESNLVGVL
jgi:ABC-type phosphate/phosphonate transport system substrate-binding protein